MRLLAVCEPACSTGRITAKRLLSGARSIFLLVLIKLESRLSDHNLGFSAANELPAAV
jgi:hypothetical protein